MVDLINTSPEKFKEALEKFKHYISNSYQVLKTKEDYLGTICGFEEYISTSNQGFLEALADYYRVTTKAFPYEKPKTITLRKKARPILILRDILAGEEPKRRYCYYGYIHLNPKFIPDMDCYVNWMTDERKSTGTITTRTGRMRVFFHFLYENGCDSIADLSSTLLLIFIQELQEKYTTQGKANILYTLRNFCCCPEIQKRLRFDPLLLLKGIHSKKHERLASCYTPEEICLVMHSVDRNTKWGKTIYLMMILACVYGLRASDIRNMQQSSIHWKQKTISLYQQKTKRYLELPLTHEVLFALLDYLKNARPIVTDPNLFIRLRSPHTPYSSHDHFGSKVSVYFKIAGINTQHKHHGLHSMRHSLATLLVAENVPINEVATVLGHTTVESTNKYIWSDIHHLKAAALEVPYYGK